MDQRHGQESLRLDPSPRPAYRAELLEEVDPGPDGIGHRVGAGRHRLPWERVERVLAAEVGEPEGVRTVVFDLVVERKQDGCLVLRFDADPAEEAPELARRLCRHLARSAISPSLQELADEGVSTRRYPDLDSLAEASLAQLGLAADPFFSA